MMPADERKKLMQILGMTGSAHDGEVLNAARLAHRLLNDHKMTWEQVFNQLIDVHAFDRGYRQGFRDGLMSQRPKQRLSWKEFARNMVEAPPGYISEWETGFFESFAQGHRLRPTEKQANIFVRVADRLGLELPD